MASKFREKVNFWGTIVFGCLFTYGAIHTVVEKLSGDPKNVAAAPATKGQSQVSRSAPEAETVPVAADAHPEDETALNILKLPELWGSVCEKIDQPKVIDRLNGTASANNHPAHVVGYQFVCVDSVGGNKAFVQYVGWMENSDTKRVECIHHNVGRARVVEDGWDTCGGNFKPQ
jgi:hypothetical protein